jgi:hypothetical protein
MLKRIEVEMWAMKHGFQKRGFHFYRERSDGSIVRLKMQPISVRYEVEVIFKIKDDEGKDKVEKKWEKLSFAYYKDLSINEDDILIGLKR